MAWAGKTRYFIGAALMLLTVALMCLGRVGLDRVSYARGEDWRSKSSRVASKAESLTTKSSGFASTTTGFDEQMKKHFSHFRYREVVPQLYDILLSALPNARNNPKDKELYEAFERGDIAAVMKIPRSERKQLFLTTVSMFYADDVAKAQFRQTATMRRDALMQDMEGMEGGEAYSEDTMAMYQEMYGDNFAEMMGLDTAAAGAEKVPGFVVMIEGYSPYQNIGALLDPPNVKDDPSRWGLVTRLENLKQFLNLDVNNAPFEVYGRLLANAASHFKIEVGPVDVDSESLPRGVGAWVFTPSAVALEAARNSPYGADMMGIQDGTWSLIDPVTRETISAETVLDAYGKPKLDSLYKPVKRNRDYWFKLQFKLQWNDAPPTPEGINTGSGRR
jgi:hypothetical protein